MITDYTIHTVYKSVKRCKHGNRRKELREWATMGTATAPVFYLYLTYQSVPLESLHSLQKKGTIPQYHCIGGTDMGYLIPNPRLVRPDVKGEDIFS